MPPGGRKRRRGPILIPLEQALLNLGEQHVVGRLLGDVVEINVDAATSHLFQSCDVGGPDLSQMTEEEVYRQRQQLWPERLLLSREDAFFAAHALGCLAVTDDQHQPLSLEALWRHFADAQPDFPQLYATCLHYRSKGWFVRPGVDFGAHFVVYPRHRSEVHAQFCCLVRSALPGAGARIEWRDVGITNRVNVQVRKTLLIVHIVEPEALDRSTPDCLRHMTIHERKVYRWVPADGVECLAKR